MSEQSLPELEKLIRSFVQQLMELEIKAISGNDMKTYAACVAYRMNLTSEAS